MQKGLSLVPMAYGLGYVSMYSAMVSIYAFDGTVAVTHGGIECGQGINTKVLIRSFFKYNFCVQMEWLCLISVVVFSRLRKFVHIL